jgi:hypothetical protein
MNVSQRESMVSHENENWSKCPHCGSRLLVEPATGNVEPCANCKSLSSSGGLFSGMFALALGVAVVVVVVIYCITLLLG